MGIGIVAGNWAGAPTFGAAATPIIHDNPQRAIQ
jgi:hypothetical protein